MAIPENYIDRITDIENGDRRYICPAADKVRVDNDNFEGTDLDEVLDEIAAGSGGYAPPAGGIPKTDLAPAVQESLDKADSAYQKPQTGIPATDLADGVIPDTSNLATKTELSDKVDKVTGYGLSKNDYTDADKAAVGTIGSKANDNVVVKSISVNGGEAQTPTQGNVNIVVQGTAGKSAYQSYLDTTTDNPPKTEPQWVASLKGEKGDTGNVEFEDLEDLVALLVNDLSTGGAGNFLSAEMGVRLKAKINEVYTVLQNVYGMLAGIAFTNGKVPSSLPNLVWDKATHTLTLSINAQGAVVKYLNSAVQNGETIQVEEGTTIEFVVESQSGLPITISSTAGTVTGNSVAFTMGIADATLDISTQGGVTVKRITDGALVEVVGSAVGEITDMVIVDDANTGCGLVGTLENDVYEGEVVAASGYGIYSVKVTKNGTDITDSSYNPVTRALNIASATGTLAVEIVVLETVNGMFSGVSYFCKGNNDDTTNSGILTQDEGWCCTPEYIEAPAGASAIRWVHQAHFTSTQQNPWPWIRRGLVVYRATNIMHPATYITVYSANETQRELSSVANINFADIKYVRASFPITYLQDCKIQFKVGDDWVDVWVGTQPHIPTNSNS